MLSAAVEGIVDEAVVRRLAEIVGINITSIYGKNGKQHLHQRIDAFNQAAKHFPWLVLVDLDQDAGCAPDLRATWLPNPAPFMCFRIAVRQVEAWLLADRDTLADFLKVNVSAIPLDPENEPHPKQRMVEIVRRSRSSIIRQTMVPREGSGRSEGPEYSSQLIEYAHEHWRPDVAAQHSDSLNRCLYRLRNDVCTWITFLNLR
jgi:hypothetical protein